MGRCVMFHLDPKQAVLDHVSGRAPRSGGPDLSPEAEAIIAANLPGSH